tara:strand:+ start:1444 stop:1932 length:489 start_codon:yes stop_codon:yes gene_type:complete
MENKKNKKYWASEIIGSTIAFLTGLGAAYAANKLTNSDAIIASSATFGTTFGWLASVCGMYGLLHKKEYKNNERNLKQDMKSLLRSNNEGILTSYSIKIGGQYCLQKFLEIDPITATMIVQPISCWIGTGVRIFRNYQRGIFGDKNKEETNNYSLEDVLLES